MQWWCWGQASHLLRMQFILLYFFGLWLESHQFKLRQMKIFGHRSSMKTWRHPLAFGYDNLPMVPLGCKEWRCVPQRALFTIVIKASNMDLVQLKTYHVKPQLSNYYISPALSTLRDSMKPQLSNDYTQFARKKSATSGVFYFLKEITCSYKPLVDIR